MANKKEMCEFGRWYVDEVDAKLARIDAELKKNRILKESDFV